MKLIFSSFVLCNALFDPIKSKIKDGRENVFYHEKNKYPGFRIRKPFFLSEKQENQYNTLTLASDSQGRMNYDGKHGIYKPYLGYNIIFNNSYYYNYPFNSWSDESCMGENVKDDIFSSKEITCDAYIDKLVISHTPDSYSFQHVLDRMLRVISQSNHLYNQSQATFTITNLNLYDYVRQLFNSYGIKHLYGANQNKKVCAKRIYYSCRTPLIHPYLSLKIKRELDIKEYPFSDKNKILYLSRTNDKNARNGGRQIANENDLLSSIRKWLNIHNKNDELVLLESIGNNLKEIQNYISKHVKCIIGPHGGAWFHHRWAGNNTLLIQFVPEKRFMNEFWEEASILGQKYYPLVLPSINHQHDMEANIFDVLAILNESYGKLLTEKTIEEM